jgi:membrane protein implicated in regulation of membrane protease activity
MKLEWLFTWWNAVYTLPLAFVLVLLTVTSIFGLAGAVMDSDHDADVDHDVDADVDVDVDVDHDLDVDADHDVDADADLDQDGDVDVQDHAIAHARGLGHADGHGPVISALAMIGVGHAPLLMVLQVFLLFWGLLGVGIHLALKAAGPGALLVSLPVTLVASAVATRLLAGAFGKVFKPFETTAVKRHHMVGRTGHVVFAVTADEGTVHAKDQHGTLHRLRARTEHGRLESGNQVVILGYDAERKLFQVDDAHAFLDRK